MLGCLINPWAAVGAVAVVSRWLRGERGVVALFKAERNATVPGFGRVIGLGEVNFKGALRREISGCGLVGYIAKSTYPSAGSSVAGDFDLGV